MTRPGPARAARLAAAAAVGIAAFALYHATLLPGVDFGDTGSFQATVGSTLITPRDAYPLYFAVGGVFLKLTHLEPAHALNLASAVEGGVAAGLLVLVGAELSGSALAGAAAALLFAVSYTFWSQAIIAEVYALHAVFVAATILLLFRWAARPTTGRLAAFFAVYALGFGNHLSMVLLLPGFTAFLLVSAPRGWRSMFAPRIVLLALACAAAGALQYAWNLRALWFTAHPPATLWHALQTFWFDVTKSDWRDTMVMQVPESMLRDRAAMYWFDLRQQFGLVGPLLAVVGLVALAIRDRRRALLMALLYLVNVIFAFSYNVGDTHVFYLPSHLMVALLAAPALASVASVAEGVTPALAVATIVFVAARAYHDFPALDRSGDRRPTGVLDRLAAGLDDRRNIFLTDLNWQIANGLSYYAKELHPEIADARMPDVLLYAPALVADNAAIGRRVFATDRARQEIANAYGPLIRTELDSSTAVPSLASEVRGLPPGTRFVLCVLRPSRDLPLDRADAAAAVDALTSGSTALPTDDYVAIAGMVGATPALVRGSAVPFQQTVAVGGVDVEIRMESWLATDTIRRMGFGQVVAARRHTLIVERGVSFAAFDEGGRPLRTSYRSNIFAPQPRYLCYR